MATADAPPSLQEILALTCSSLVSQDDDEIRKCGPPALHLLRTDPEMCLKFAYQKLHDVPYRDVKACWRRLYVDAALWKVVGVLKGMQKRERDGGVGGDREDEDDEGYVEREKDSKKDGAEEDWISEVVRMLDMALILTGAPAREELVELMFSALQGILEDLESNPTGGRQEIENHINIDNNRPQKRRKLDPTQPTRPTHQSHIPATFPTTVAHPPSLRYPITRVSDLSLETFQRRISDPPTQTPLIIEGAIDYWPALDERPWSKPSYLLSHTLGGRRLVPVEIGRSYTDHGWGQKILSFGEFMGEYMFQDEEALLDTCAPCPTTTAAELDTLPNPITKRKTGYLAQHDLFAQIPSLRADISIPDYCYADAPPNPRPSQNKPVPKLETPLLNAWFGPAHTISPLHTDPYHNILAQVVGYKYVRLYAPTQTPALYALGVDESNGVDMSNTSGVDLDEGLNVYPGLSPWGRRSRSNGDCGNGDENEDDDEKNNEEARKEFEAKFPNFKDAEYVEGVLGPGDCLYIPVGWWHYVRSLSPSCSVSFWFN